MNLGFSTLSLTVQVWIEFCGKVRYSPNFQFLNAQVSGLRDSRTFNSFSSSLTFIRKTGIFHTTFENSTMTFMFLNVFYGPHSRNN